MSHEGETAGATPEVGADGELREPQFQIRQTKKQKQSRAERKTSRDIGRNTSIRFKPASNGKGSKTMFSHQLDDDDGDDTEEETDDEADADAGPGAQLLMQVVDSPKSGRRSRKAATKAAEAVATLNGGEGSNTQPGTRRSSGAADAAGLTPLGSGSDPCSLLAGLDGVDAGGGGGGDEDGTQPGEDGGPGNAAVSSGATVSGKGSKQAVLPALAANTIVQWLDKAADLGQLLQSEGPHTLGAFLSCEHATPAVRAQVYDYLDKKLLQQQAATENGGTADTAAGPPPPWEPRDLAIILQAIQHVAQPEACDFDAVVRIFKSAKGIRLSDVKHATDMDDDKDLINLVYNFLDDQHRASVLRHIATQAETHHRKRRCVHVLSDLDDTFVHSGLGLGGPKWPKGTVMPGVIRLFAALEAKVVFLTARPDWEWISRFTKKTVRETYGLNNAGLMLGKLRDSVLIPFKRNTANQMIARRKFENYSCCKALYPECCFVWLGDTGQADIQVGLQMKAADKTGSVVGSFIQDVSLEDGVHLKTPQQERERLRALGVTLCNNYIDVALGMYRAEVLSVDRLKDVTEGTLTEFLALQAKCDGIVFEARRLEMERSMQDVNLVLKENMLPPVEWPAPIDPPAVETN